MSRALILTVSYFTPIVVAMLSAEFAYAACNLPQFDVIGSYEEELVACRSLHAVQDYFQSPASEVPEITVVFEDAIHFEDETIGRAVTGTFWRQGHLIEATRPAPTKDDDREHWRLPWSTEMSASILTHEIVHAFSAARDNEIPEVWREYIAYAVQFELMDVGFRKRILTGYGNVVPFDHTSQVNDMNYLIDPDLFAVRAYLHSVENGGRSYIEKVLSQEIDTRPPRFSF